VRPILAFLLRRGALELNDRTLRAIAGCAQVRLTVRAPSACFGVSAPTFLDFLKRHPEAKQVWQDNIHVGRAKLRRILWRQAEKDLAQARFLAKDSRWLAMDEGEDRIAEAQAQVPGVTINPTVEDRIRQKVNDATRRHPSPSG
jgi:hypothetical protein